MKIKTLRLKDFRGIRELWAKALLHEAYVALDEGRLDDAKRKRTEIEQQIGVDEPELARINLRIERPEARGRG